MQATKCIYACRRSQEFLGGTPRARVTSVLEVGDTVEDKSDSIPFLVLCQSWILGAIAPSAPWLRLCKKGRVSASKCTKKSARARWWSLQRSPRPSSRFGVVRMEGRRRKGRGRKGGKGGKGKGNEKRKEREEGRNYRKGREVVERGVKGGNVASHSDL